jgi:glycosyltransferase involved in cell wall biosynthesis
VTMLDGAKVVCLSPIPWSGLWTSRHELAREMAERGADVLFVDPPRNAMRPTSAAERGGSRRPVPAGLQVVTPPPYLPYGVLAGSPRLLGAVMRFNADRYAHFVKRQVGAGAGGAAGDRVILLNSFMPVLGPRVAPLLRPDVHVYHRADELRSYGTCRPAYLDSEREVMSQADVVVCVSDAVRAGIASDRPDAHVVPNGVANRRFASAVPDPRLADLAGPIAVLVGTVDDRVEEQLLHAVAAGGVTVVVAGPVSNRRLPDGAVTLGPVEPDEVPGILAAADVGLVPYRTTWPGDVLKTYEYLAAGLPVVATRLPCLAADTALAGLITTVDPGDFAAAVLAEVTTGDRSALAAQRRAAAAEHDWSRRLDQLIDLVGEAVPA